MRRLIIIWALSLISITAFAQNDVLKYSMKTKWAKEVDINNPHPEYPRPQLKRETFWQSLNGQWEYAIIKKGRKDPKKFDGNITVPFAVESELSGVKKTVGEDNYLWYKKTFASPALKDNERLVINFGAIDWEATIYVNGKELGMHRGGYDAFSMDVTDYLRSEATQELKVRVWDPSDQGTQPRGKQVKSPFGIWYTPVTGIWQSVWLEKVPQTRITNLKLTPDVDNRVLRAEIITEGEVSGLTAELIASAGGNIVQTKTIRLDDGVAVLEIEQPRLWSPEDPFLYDLKVRLMNNSTLVDEVDSYFGMRKVSLGKDANGFTRIMLNDQPLFQFGLLDQGWWPDGLYTAPTEEAMLYDVKMTKEMGFNMIRKHVKVEPARYYYHCDTMGMLVWQDMPNGNYLNELRIEAWETEDAKRTAESAEQYELELKRMMDQFHSFPSIQVWVPFNEGWGQYDTKRVTEWVVKYDTSRLIDSPSGWADRGVGDMIDIHLYPGPGMEPVEEHRASVLGEFGGLGYPVKGHLWWDKKNWGYLTYHDEKTYLDEFEKLMKSLQGLVSNGLSAAIYTQTTDVEGEVNGLITYDREVVKVKPAKLKKLIDPLYDEYWAPRFLVKDSEQSPNQWKMSKSIKSEGWKDIDFDDFQWKAVDAPLSSYDNPFLGSFSPFEPDSLYLRKEFTVSTIPDRLYLKYYLPKASIKLWLNGQLIQEIKDQGGRKRHYTDIDISDFAAKLEPGKNVIAVQLLKMGPDASFDIGLYTSKKMKAKETGSATKNEGLLLNNLNK